MFSVSETTLSVLRIASKSIENFRIYAIVPYAYEYVRLSTKLGLSGLARKLGKQIIFSGNIKAIFTGLKGISRINIEDLLKTYLLYEISRIKDSINKKQTLYSIFLHEIITDMALALQLDWLFSSYIEFMLQIKIKPGFETRNFAYLVNQFKEWNIDFSKITIVAPFNKVGFQMNPSKIECEKKLATLPESDIIAMSILAAGYLNLPEATEYLQKLPNIGSVVVGVSKEYHARETFQFLHKKLHFS